MIKPQKAIFLDRDGVLIYAPTNSYGKPKSIKTKSEIRFSKGIKSFCKIFKKKNFLLIMITNQPEYSLKKNTKKNIEEINRHVKRILNLDDIFVCYSNDENNFYRKPNPGMLLEAKSKYNILIKKSYFIGDRWRDIDAGNRIGCKTIFINRNYNEKLRTKPKIIIKKISQIYRFII